MTQKLLPAFLYFEKQIQYSGLIMKTIILAFVLNFSGLFGGEYWQQLVTYKMDVKLDTVAHTIGGHSTIIYLNNSPDTLQHFYLNLYANAFQEGTVKHREYLAGLGRASRGARFKKGMDPYFSKYDISNFKIEEKDFTLTDTFRIDDTILSADLSKGLAPGASMTINLDWTQNVGEFSERAGRVGEQYNFAQWYPRVVVYDENGWFNEPFHAEGEFYGEFGTYNVTMDVPRGYVIGSTGTVTKGDPGWEEVRVDTSQKFSKWLKEFKSNRPKYDSDERRVVSFYAEDVHDFAWVTTPNFLYESGQWNGVDVHALFNQKNGKKWTKKAVARTERAIEWLSTKFGMYPYPQVTNTDRLAGGGMEYPMLVMDGSESEGLILHEVGHIWFYGIIGNNEVREAWMDEGFTSFQTRWYMMDRYGKHGFDMDGGRLKDWQKKYWKFGNSLGNTQWGMINFMSSGQDEPISRSTYMFKGTRAAGANAYTKPSLMLDELKYILGEEVFIKGMQEYYRRWNLKHTNEKRFIDAMEDVSGEDLDWFFRPWLHDTRLLDYGINNWKKNQKADDTWDITLNIERHGNRDMPQLIETTLADGSKHRIWWKNHKFRVKDTFTYNVPSKPDYVTLDPEAQTMDIDYRNNFEGINSPLYVFTDGHTMPNETMFYRPGMRYSPRNRYVVQYHPTLHYLDKDGYMPGFSFKRSYSMLEYVESDLNVGLETKETFYKLAGWTKRPHKSIDQINYHIFDFRGVRGSGLTFTKEIDRNNSVNGLKRMNFGFYENQVKDTSRTHLYDKGRMIVASTKIHSSFFKIKNEISFDFTPFKASDWSFSRIVLTNSFDERFGLFGARFRQIYGQIWSNQNEVPLQERFNVEGAGSGDLYHKSYLRDNTSFYGNKEFFGRYHMPGDANLRAFGNQGLSGVEQVFAITFEGFLTKSIAGINFELAGFIDQGTLTGSKFVVGDKGFNNSTLMDYGIGLRISTSIFGQPLYLRIDKPFNATIDGNSIEKMNDWVLSFQKSI
tara:strand:+ start:181 stop:3207 length:3027 start_codon:yes stop_codon:yes gene_type:complete